MSLMLHLKNLPTLNRTGSFWRRLSIIVLSIGTSPLSLHIPPCGILDNTSEMFKKHLRLDTFPNKPTILPRICSSFIFPHSSSFQLCRIKTVNSSLIHLFLTTPRSVSCTFKTVPESNHFSPPSPL